jgi:predicted DNA-binding transcriptional regulator AlpA
MDLEQFKTADWSAIPSDTTITADHIAVMLGCSPRTVLRMVEAGEVPQPIRIGSRKRWRLGTVLAFIRSPPGQPEEKTGP